MLASQVLSFSRRVPTISMPESVSGMLKASCRRLRLVTEQVSTLCPRG